MNRKRTLLFCIYSLFLFILLKVAWRRQADALSRYAVISPEVAEFTSNRLFLEPSNFSLEEMRLVLKDWPKTLGNLVLLNNVGHGVDISGVVKIIQDFWLFHPSLLPYNLSKPEVKDTSKGQAALVDTLLNRKKKGFFVECGALDGEIRSNTLFFERERGWEGLLIEADPTNFQLLLQKHRKAYMVNCCLNGKPQPNLVKFNMDFNVGRILSNKDQVKWVLSNGRQRLNPVKVQCFPILSLLLAINQTTVDYFSLDVEGEEMEVLRSIPFNLVDIRVFSVEITHSTEGPLAIEKFMRAKGYQLVSHITAAKLHANDYIFQKMKNLIP